MTALFFFGGLLVVSVIVLIIALIDRHRTEHSNH